MAVAVENNLAIMKEGEQVSDAMERLERKIDKEIAKLEYYMGPVDDLIESNDYFQWAGAP